MRILALFILRRAGINGNSDPGFLAKEFNLGSYSYFQRSMVRQFFTFSARTAVSYSTPASKSAMENSEDAHVFVYCLPSGLASVAVTDIEYPKRCAYHVLRIAVDAFVQ
jgi:synaptobrevin family protein YKT6